MGAGGANISDFDIQTKGDASQSSVRLYCLPKPGRFAAANVGVGGGAGLASLSMVLFLALSRLSADGRD